MHAAAEAEGALVLIAGCAALTSLSTAFASEQHCSETLHRIGETNA
jgi:hypothetical protein